MPDCSNLSAAPAALTCATLCGPVWWVWDFYLETPTATPGV